MAVSPTKKPATKTPVKKTASTKKSAAKPTVKKTTAKKPTAKKATTKPRKISAEERYRMVQTAAYYIAEQNNFQGSSMDFWIAAEQEISKVTA